jgi:hypothetical protein
MALKRDKTVVAIKPKPPFKSVFQVAASRKKSDIRILNEPLKDSSMFLVETGEALSTSNPPVSSLLDQRRAYAVSFCI